MSGWSFFVSPATERSLERILRALGASWSKPTALLLVFYALVGQALGQSGEEREPPLGILLAVQESKRDPID